MKVEIDVYDDNIRTWETQKGDVDSIADLKEVISFINSSPFREACHIRCEELDIDQTAQSLVRG